MRHLSDQLRHHASSLALAGVPSPRVDAELIAAHVLGVSRGKLLVVDLITDAQAARIRELVAARAERVPL
jgi:release factor glutamine methyltransferase